MVEAHVLAVANGAGGEEAREAPLDRIQKLGVAVDVQEALLLAGEARRRQVLGGGRRADRHVGEVFPVAGGQFTVAPQYLRL